MANGVKISLLSLLLAAPAIPTMAQAPSSFPFVIPWDDSSAGTATDVSFLNAKPAGGNGYITPKNGHFVEARTGKRVRFIGVNLAAHSAFPDHGDAEKVAARLAKYGVNIVRLHHMDNDFWSPDATIWDGSYKDHRHINPAQLDKLDYLIAQLKKNGIYANINLHVSRQFSEADGFPASVEKIPTSFDKRVDYYDRKMIALQKEYAKQLLTHVNPYTKSSYAEDPCVAVVEINNENSLVGDPWANIGGDLDQMPEPFRGELVGFWNDWLTKKYGSDAKVQAAWLKGVTATGPSVVTPSSQWSIEHQGTSDAAIETAAFATPETAPGAHVTVKQVDGTDWHVQIHVTGLTFKEGDTYTVSFRAKADKPRAMAVGAGLDQADWHNIGLAATSGVTADWKEFHYTFDARNTVVGHGRVAFTLGNQTGEVDIADLRVRPGAEGAGLQQGESISTKTVPIPLTATKAQRADWLTFLVDTERSYTDEMRGYLKKDLGIHANIICSQISWGGIAGLNREADMDFADNHAYWQHPDFPHKAWDAEDWNIANTPMVADLAKGGGGTLRDLAQYRIAGKPYTVSEYNHPAPSDYQAETVPEIASYAAYQDWDIVYMFDYGGYGKGANNDRIDGYFSFGSNPAKWAFMPAAALIFRNQSFMPATNSIVAGPPQGGWHAALANGIIQASDVWKPTGHAADFLSAKIALGSKAGISNVGKPESTVKVSNTAAGAQYIADSPNAIALAGFLGGQTVTTKSVEFQFQSFGDDSAPAARNFAALTLTPLDSRPIINSKRLLLTVVSRVENQGMKWNATRTSIGTNWGSAPSTATGVPLMLKFSDLKNRTVYALDSTGKRVKTLPNVGLVAGVVIPTISVGPEYKTVWYEITM